MNGNKIVSESLPYFNIIDTPKFVLRVIWDKDDFFLECLRKGTCSRDRFYESVDSVFEGFVDVDYRTVRILPSFEFGSPAIFIYGTSLYVRSNDFVLKEDIGSVGVEQVYNNIRSVLKFILAYRTKHEGNNFVLVCEDIKWSYTEDTNFI